MMKFIASDVESAKSKAKRALGDAMVVIRVRNLPSGDVEISASDKPEPSAPIIASGNAHQAAGFGDEARRNLEAQAQQNSSPTGTGARLNEPVERKFAEDALSKLRGDLADRSHGGHSSTLPDNSMSNQTTAGLIDLLRPHGIDNKLLQDIISGASRAPIDDDLYRLQTGFAETFEFAPLDLFSTTPIMLVGPTGAGKTSSCAKLAAAAITSTGHASIMTADVGRAGAIEQIKTYGNSLGANYFIVETPTDVTDVLKSDRPGGLIILDTPGVSPYDLGDIAALKSFADAAGAEPILVLPAGGDVAEYSDWGEAFLAFGVRRLILTKFDATRRVGAGIMAAFAGKMALAHFSETAFISEGLIDANPEFLARRFISSRPGKMF